MVNHKSFLSIVGLTALLIASFGLEHAEAASAGGPDDDSLKSGAVAQGDAGNGDDLPSAASAQTLASEQAAMESEWTEEQLLAYTKIHAAITTQLEAEREQALKAEKVAGEEQRRRAAAHEAPLTAEDANFLAKLEKMTEIFQAEDESLKRGRAEHAAQLAAIEEERRMHKQKCAELEVVVKEANRAADQAELKANMIEWLLTPEGQVFLQQQVYPLD